MPAFAPALRPNGRRSSAPELPPNATSGQRGGVPLFTQRREAGGSRVNATGTSIEEEAASQNIQSERDVGTLGPSSEEETENMGRADTGSASMVSKQGARGPRRRRLLPNRDGYFAGFRPNWSYVRTRALAFGDITPYVSPFSVRDFERGAEHVIIRATPGQAPSRWRISLHTYDGPDESATHKSPQANRIEVRIRRRVYSRDVIPGRVLEDVVAEDVAHEFTHVLLIIEGESTSAAHTQTFVRYQDFMTRSNTSAARAAYQHAERAAAQIIRLIAARNQIVDESVTNKVIARYSGEIIREHFINELFVNTATMPPFGRTPNVADIAGRYTNGRIRGMHSDLATLARMVLQGEPIGDTVWEVTRNAFRDYITEFYRLILAPPPTAPAAARTPATRP